VDSSTAIAVQGLNLAYDGLPVLKGIDLAVPKVAVVGLVGRGVSQLSGGDAQKLSIVLALAHDPSVVIMDEPVASLDPMTRREFLRALFERGDDGSERTVLLSSHLPTDLECCG
jgi:ABC-type Mn2+/Zn2+ transport system ATPase subunit